MTDMNEKWDETITIKDVDHFADWSNTEAIFGESGEPGFSQKIYGLRWAPIDPDNVVQCTFTTYRSDDGKLLCVHGCYDKNGVQTPFLFYVHPDHMRMGIGTKMADFIVKKYLENRGEHMPYDKNWKGAEVSDAALSFMKKYSNNELLKRTNGQDV
jgi:GNAT superfamily N-acetyltransferase